MIKIQPIRFIKNTCNLFIQFILLSTGYTVPMASRDPWMIFTGIMLIIIKGIILLFCQYLVIITLLSRQAFILVTVYRYEMNLNLLYKILGQRTDIIVIGCMQEVGSSQCKEHSQMMYKPAHMAHQQKKISCPSWIQSISRYLLLDQ